MKIVFFLCGAYFFFVYSAEFEEGLNDRRKSLTLRKVHSDSSLMQKQQENAEERAALFAEEQQRLLQKDSDRNSSESDVSMTASERVGVVEDLFNEAQAQQPITIIIKSNGTGATIRRQRELAGSAHSESRTRGFFDFLKNDENEEADKTHTDVLEDEFKAQLTSIQSKTNVLGQHVLSMEASLKTLQRLLESGQVGQQELKQLLLSRAGTEFAVQVTEQSLRLQKLEETMRIREGGSQTMLRETAAMLARINALEADKQDTARKQEQEEQRELLPHRQYRNKCVNPCLYLIPPVVGFCGWIAFLIAQAQLQKCNGSYYH